MKFVCTFLKGGSVCVQQGASPREMWISVLRCASFSRRTLEWPSPAMSLQHTQTFGWGGWFLKKIKTKQPINQKDQKPGIPVLLHSLPLTEDELRVLGRCLCEAVFKATSWCSFTWVRFVSCVPQGLAPSRILQGVKVMAKWKHHLPRCLQHTLPLRAPPGSALLVTCHQKLGLKERCLPQHR